MLLITTEKMSQVLEPYLNKRANNDQDYNLAMLSCPECGLVAVRVESGLDTAEANAERVQELRSEVRVDLSDHLLAKD